MGSTSVQSRYLALQLLEDLIKFRWQALTPQQREEIRSDLVTKIITVRARAPPPQLGACRPAGRARPPPHPLAPSSPAARLSPQLSRDEAVLRSESLLIKKMNVLLVGILKHDWPARWPSFIPDIVAASKCA